LRAQQRRAAIGPEKRIGIGPRDGTRELVMARGVRIPSSGRVWHESSSLPSEIRLVSAHPAEGLAMTRFLVSAATVALLSTPSLAADLPIEPLPVIEAPVPAAFTWTGFYLGINGGFAFAEKEVDLDYTSPTGWFDACLAVGLCLTELEYDTDGFLIGGHAGYNYQLGSVVVGVEGDIDFSDMEGSVSVDTSFPQFFDNTFSASTDYDIFGTFRGRLGWGLDRFLVYATGGLAFADVENSVSRVDDLDEHWVGSDDALALGWTAGGGVEFAVTENIFIGAEALYFDLGEESVDLDSVGSLDPPPGADIDANFENTGVIVRGRVSVRFAGLVGGF
jgi:outer membrane immunogenic protein